MVVDGVLPLVSLVKQPESLYLLLLGRAIRSK